MATSRSTRLLLLATAAFLLVRIPVIALRVFDPDELEHAHAAWCVFRGMLPYRDFFEHHTPWYYYLLCPFFGAFDVDGSFASARHFLLLGRGLSLVLTLVSILLVFRIGRLWQSGQDRRVGALAGLLLVAQPIFFQKTLEMRPDVLALPFFLGGVWFLLRGLGESTESSATDVRGFLAAGLSIGAAIMCTQKMLFVLPGVLAALGLWSLFGAKSGRRSRVLASLAFIAGVCVPAALTWAAFARHHAGGEFIANNFVLNAKWKSIETNQFVKLMETSGPVLALSVVGVVASGRRSRGLLLACILVGLFAGVLVIPSAHRQYYLMPLPIVSLFAAKGLLVVIERVRARDRARKLLLVLAPIGLAILPVVGLVQSFRSRNDVQLARLRQVFENTEPTDLVMDGWEGMGVFRPHAFRYFFLHDETMQMLPRSELDAYLDDLESGRVRPRLIAMDEHLVALGPRFLRLVERDYTSRDGFLYFSNRRVH